MTSADIPAGLRLCRASGWNQTARDWAFFLAAAPHGALVAVDAGVVVGTVSTLPYGAFTWISMVLVDPAARGRGIGTRLLTEGILLVPKDSTARLDATPAGERVYRKRGFEGEFGLARWSGPARTPAFSPRRPLADSLAPPWLLLGASARRRPLASPDWPAVLERDALAFGASRADLLARLALEAPEYAWVAEAGGTLRGYVFGRRGHARDQIGPLIADNADTAAGLLDACLAAHADRTVFIDVPEAQPAFRARLIDLGFAIERPFLRMHLGPLTAPGRPGDVYAITGPEFG